MESKFIGKKPFDLEEARNGKPLCTRSGKNAKIIYEKEGADNYPLIALIEDKTSDISYTVFCRIDGRLFEEKESDNDLFIAVESYNGFANVYQTSYGGNFVLSEKIFKDEKTAIKEGKNGRNSYYYITTIPIKWGY